MNKSFYIFTNDGNNVKDKACENGIKMHVKRESKTGYFQAVKSSLFSYRHCLERANRDMMVIELSS